MEEKKKKKQEEKTKKEIAQKKAADQKPKVPEPAPTKPSPGPSHHPASPTLPLSSSSSSSGNGKRASCSSQLLTQTPPQQQCQLSSASARYPPREVPPRFRQQEHKQLLKRGQPLPAGALSTLTLSSSCSSSSSSPSASYSSSTSTSSTTTNSTTSTASKHHQDISLQCGPGAQYEISYWGASVPVDSPSSANSWDKVIIDKSDTEAWPSISRSSDPCNPVTPECPSGSTSSNLDTSAVTTTSRSSFVSMATGAAGQQAHYPSLKANNNMMTGPGSTNALVGNRGWVSDGKQDGMNSGRVGAPNNWGSSNFNLNLNPNANPSAWPVLGHESVGGGTSGVSSSSSLPPGINGNGNLGNGNMGGADNGGGSWVGMMSATENEQQHPSTNTNLSFNIEPVNLNTDGPNHTKQQQAQEPMSPIHGLTGWGGQSPTESSQLNGDTTGSSVWGSGETKAADSPKDSSWDSTTSGGLSAWGRQGSGGGSSGSGGWGDWGKSSGGGEATKGWDNIDAGSSGSGQDQQLSSWGQQLGTAPASEDSGDSSEGRSQRRDRSSSMEFAPMLPRQDLDPRVLSNTGWGQTPVRQNTVWEMEEANSDDGKSSSSSDTIGASSSNGGPSSTNGTITPTIAQRPGSGGKSDSEGSSSSGWGAPASQPVQTGSGWGDPPQSLSKAPNGTTSGWGDPLPSSGPKNGGTSSWGSEDKSSSWDNGLVKNQPTSWGEGPKNAHKWGNNNGGSNGSTTGEWGEPDIKNNGSSSSMWEGEGSNGGNGGWKESPRGANGGGWGKTPAVSNSSWGETSRANGPVQGGWGSSKPQESSSSSTGSGGGGSIGSWGGPSSVKQNNSSWGNVSKQDQGMEPTGWEEPSPPSIRRKMEIDDGTSTWGDPSAYNKTVNMWDRNNPTSNPGNSGPPPSKNGGMIIPNNNNNNHSVGPGNNNHHHSHPHHMHHHTHHGQPPTHLQHHGNNNGSPNNAASHPSVGPQGRPTHSNPGWGEIPSVQPKSEPAWGEPAAPTSAVDNGTSAWGKPPGGVGGWGDGGHESSGPYGRGSGPPGSAPCKPGPKPMQDGWGNGGEEMGMSTSQWDTEDGDVWNSPTPQESSSSCNSWSNGPKKCPNKGKMGNKPDEAWIMNRLIKQLTDMGFPRDPAEEALKSNNMNLDQAMTALLEKKTDLDKRGMGMSDYSNGMNKPLVCRPSALSKDPSERNAFLDKDGVLSDDTPPSPFLPSPSLKLPLANSSLPGQGLGQGNPGLAMQNLNRQIPSGMFGSSGAAQTRAMQQQPPQPPVPPLSSSQPSLRAQVPPFLSPQVQAQLLQFAAKNIGLNPALLTSPINPQQMTLLYQLQQLQMAYQRLQIQHQMMQAQRNVSGPIRQQEQQVARTITNMQQQIQQHQRQLYQALLMKQQQLPSHSSSSSSSTGLHPPGGPAGGPGSGKSTLDPFTGTHQAPSLADTLHTKEPPSSPSAYSTYPLSGLNPNMNVNCMEVGGLSLKEPPQPQSRLSQWTHSNSMDNLSGNSSNLENNLNKHGAISAASTLVPPGKPPQLEDSYSPYNLISSSESPTSPLVPPDWGQGKSPSEKISNGTNINWPPEFCPGVPWKGLQNIDPENDPNMTPGSVPSGPTINTNIHDVNRYLLRDRNGGKLSDMKSTWSPGPISQSQASLSHELWKVPQGPRSTTAPSRPPPGLTNTKPSSTWGGNSLGLSQGWSGSYSSEGTTWSTDSSNRTSSWLVLRNLTPQIDGSTLRTLCMQHGPLITFHLNLTQGNAVVRYSSKDEAAKAQKSLHMCVLGNTTILAEFAGEEEVNRFFAQGQSLGANTTSWQANPGTNQNRMGGAAQSHSIGQWSSSTGGGKASGGDLLWGGVPQYSSLWGPPSGEDARVIGSPTPINTLLPGDLLSGESM
ncbi:trinucleotide repeat-containing gene 6C protein isoform X1 [Astatotilapia calliptera]|uniref:trinucleotide repeat-containing gene 6C protein isoform X1 n=1 Tax=Astatotilapia calliptera TaxID=8154 RepID=UPI000E424397|nr:trinucleotide repeat-containing gene 6C protein-like isoform X1 [Astatotilapia calliptera]XP_026026368.1 trinucleotide repeat-containing gene 6C protein-like isoform X1 [Astatotilapia calliptera]